MRLRRVDDGGELQAIDLLLGEGAPSKRDALRERIARDVAAAVDYAETLDLVERLRELKVVASPRLNVRLAAVRRKAENFARERRRGRAAGRVGWITLAASAAAVAALQFVYSRTEPSPEPKFLVAAQPQRGLALHPPLLPAIPPVDDAAWSRLCDDLQLHLRVEPYSTLLAARERTAVTKADPVDLWLQPQIAIASRATEYPLRQVPERRRRSLELRGDLAMLDDRVQRLADAVATALRDDLATATAAPVPVALAVRALLAAGSDRGHPAMHSGADWLAARLPSLQGGELASALAALGELSAATRGYAADLREHGERLIAETVSRPITKGTVSASNAVPPLLRDGTPSAQLGDAGSFLALAPAFGVDPDAAHALRTVLCGKLQQRLEESRAEATRATGVVWPDLAAALAYGYADLLADFEHFDLERQLRAWRPSRLSPDFVTLHQLAWSRQPAKQYEVTARFPDLCAWAQRVATPQQLGDRAALCLFLATNFAAPHVAALAQMAD